MDNKKIFDQLNKPQTPNDLEFRIINNWYEQRIKQKSTKPILAMAVGICFLCLMLGAVWIGRYLYPQDLITAAINDINNDLKHDVDILLPISSVAKDNNFNLPPKELLVKMTKMCKLGRNRAVHVHLQSKTQGNIHLFIKKGNFAASIVQSSSAPHLPWRLIKAPSNLSVLVVHSIDMNPMFIDALIQSMFYT